MDATVRWRLAYILYMHVGVFLLCSQAEANRVMKRLRSPQQASGRQCQSGVPLTLNPNLGQSGNRASTLDGNPPELGTFVQLPSSRSVDICAPLMVLGNDSSGAATQAQEKDGHP